MLRRCALVLATLVLGQAWAQPWIHPFPSGSISILRPSIGAYLAPELWNGPVKITIDGRDFSSEARSQSGCISWAAGYDLDRGQHSAVVEGHTRAGQSVTRSWSFVVAQPANLEVVEFTPHQSQSVPRNSLIRARFSAPIEKGRLYLDGRQQTAQAWGDSLQYQPPRPLPAGRHRVALSAQGLDGAVIEKSWYFVSANRPTEPTASQPISIRPAAASMVLTRTPLPGQFTDGKPQLRIQFREPVSQSRLIVDSQDLTSAARSGNDFLWQSDYFISAGPHRIRVDAQQANGPTVSESWSFYAVRYGGEVLAAMNRLLPPGGITRETPELDIQPSGPAPLRPTLGFSLPPGKQIQQFVLVADGNDLTGTCSTRGGSVRWTPNYDLERGNHTVCAIARATDNSLYYRNWDFEVR